MTFVVQGFPGNPVTQNAVISNAAVTVTLPIPPANTRQYLAGVLVSAAASAAGGSSGVVFTGLDTGSGGSQPNFIVTAPPNAGLTFGYAFPRPWPAAAQASAISATIQVGLGALQQISLFGYNVPE